MSPNITHGARGVTTGYEPKSYFIQALATSNVLQKDVGLSKNSDILEKDDGLVFTSPFGRLKPSTCFMWWCVALPALGGALSIVLFDNLQH